MQTGGTANNTEWDNWNHVYEINILHTSFEDFNACSNMLLESRKDMFWNVGGEGVIVDYL